MSQPPVILLHGLRHTSLSMRPVQRALTEAGRETFNIGYLSGRFKLEQLAKRIWENIRTRFGDSPGPLDFVGHSMGCILTRIIGRDDPGVIRRAVMLAPPNKGSELVDRFVPFAPARWIMGPAGQQLGISAGSVPNTLGPPNFEAGVIAGSKPDNPFSRWFIEGEEDGRVSVERTRLEGMADHIVLPHGHFFIMRKPDVIVQTVHFLETGRFLREAE